MERVLIIGAGPLARIVPEVVANCNSLELIGFVDIAGERRSLVGDAAEFPVYEKAQFPRELKNNLGEFSVLIAGSLRGLRPQLITETEEAGLTFINIIHPGAIIARSANLGQSVLLLPGVIIGPGASIGSYVTLSSAATIDHDSIVEDGVTLGPGVHLAGGITVKGGTLIGVGACATNGVTIGSNSIIGAGSVVTECIPDNVIAAGVPAKIIRSRD